MRVWMKRRFIFKRELHPAKLPSSVKATFGEHENDSLVKAGRQPTVKLKELRPGFLNSLTYELTGLC